MDRRAKKIERDLLSIIALYLLGSLTREQTRTRGLQQIDESFRGAIEEVNQFYREQGLTGLEAESIQLRKRWDEIALEFNKLLDTDDPYWKSEAGIRKNAGMLAMLIAYAVASTVTVSIALELPGVLLVWNTVGDDRVCEICEGFAGTYSPLDPDLPSIPPHPGGRCWWEIVFR